ncbi:type II secretory pathway, component PulK [Candidatus Scalindua japonica]|uniref:Type II secretory pathway, component PulK n=1 Tax=Candidatus Scalindua japonica TaxID=1284222 RepID=A0A286TYC1_9BACT|nr:lamin tail domain-containing protein [Candidatus Scalindua japonica]GAX60864.1 type II secretory pathway, component PulK [Candidatus Scalindua japonica]
MADSKNENGYVLVVIIGILTILSLMMITFATLSRIETRATRNYTDSVKCEKIAKAGLEHAIYEIWLDKFGTDSLAYNDDDNGNYELDENFDSTGASWPGNSRFPGSDYDNDGDTTDDSRWIYFPATDSASDIRLPGRLRAKYAVLISDDKEARVNVNVTGNEASGSGVHTSNEGWSTFEIDLSNIIELAATGKGDTTASDIIDTRLGSDDAPGTSAINDNAGIVPDPEADGIDNDGDSVLDESDEATDEPNEFNSIYPYSDDIPFGLLSEAEIMGTSSYTSRLETIFNTRGVSDSEQNLLNNLITTYSADTIVCRPYTLAGSTSTTKLNINALVNNGAYTDIQKVEMIMDTLVAGGITGTPAKDIERHQLAVNIKDFTDSDNTVTAYNDGSNTYYGIERTPYINEVEAWTTTGTDEFIELFNPYDTEIPNTGDWTITLDGDTTTITLPGLTVPAGGYFVIADQAGARVNQIDTNINNLDDGGEELILRDSSGNVVQVTNYGSANQNDTCSLNDPRPIPLSASASNPWNWAINSSNTIGAENSNFNPTVGSDGWTVVTQANSFLVANRRFSNIGYLGFIHKGSEWSSTRVGDTPGYPIVYPDLLDYITVTDPSMDSIDNDGDGDIDSIDTGYQQGDLDGPEYRIPGLINVNTAPTEVLASLPDGLGGTLGSTIASEIFNGNKPYESIGDLIDKVDGADGITDTSASDKWNEEEALRAISNLITTRSNVFTVYVTAQITNEGETEVFAEKRILALVDRSVDPIEVRYFRLITE